MIVLSRLALVCVLLTPCLSFSQEHFSFDGYCTFDGQPIQDAVYTFDSDQDALKWTKKICKKVGLDPNFKVLVGNVPNAVAAIRNGERYIVYSQYFMEQMDESSGTDWASISILAHEIGHHLQGHTLSGEGSTPPKELQADRFSGFVLAKLGATEQQARAAMTHMPSAGSSSHPPSSARLEAISLGWKDAKEMTDEINTIGQNPEPTTPTPQKEEVKFPTPPPNNVPTIIATIQLNGKQFFLSSSGQILGQSPFGGPPIIFGWKQPSQQPHFAWVIQTPQGFYGVDAHGVVVGWNQYGNPVQVGFVTAVN